MFTISRRPGKVIAMRIGNDSVSRIPSTYARPHNWEGPQRHVISGAALRRDAVTLSGAGLARANLRARDEISLWGTGAASSDPAINLMEESIAEVGNLMEEMRALSKTAEDEELTDLDRIDMQIQMQRLQNKLAKATGVMGLRMSGASEGEIAKGNDPIFLETNGIAPLLRARERIMNGEEWDVAEKWGPKIVREIRVLTPHGERIFPAQPGDDFKLEDFEFPEDITPFEAAGATELLSIRGSEWKVTDRAGVPTLSERMKQGNAVLLMDAKSARDGTERLDRELEALLVLRDELRTIPPDPTEQQAILPDEPPLTESEIDVLIGSFHMKEQQESEKLRKELDAQATGDPTYEEGSGESEGSEDRGGRYKKKIIDTAVGVMLYDEDGPHLISPRGKKGRLFAKLERFFKDRIEKNFGALFIEITGTEAEPRPIQKT